MSLFVAQLRCPSCDNREFFDRAHLLQWLQDHGYLKRDAKPEAAMMMELGQLVSAGQRCRQCDRSGLALEAPEEEDADWGDARRCENCRETIDPLRLEVFPDTLRCTTCQVNQEQGQGDDDLIEYCPKCGSPMEITTRQRGVTRYQLVCRACRS